MSDRIMDKITDEEFAELIEERNKFVLGLSKITMDIVYKMRHLNET